MPKAKIGLITVSLPRERVDLAKHWNMLAREELEKAGLEVLHREQLAFTVDETVNTAKSMQRDGADSIIYLLGTWIYAPQVVTSAQEVTLPTILWSPRDAAAFSLTGAGVTHGSLDEVGVKHKFVYGSPKDAEVIGDITSFARAAMVVNRMKRQKLGLIGGRVAGMYTTTVDMAQVKSIFQVEIEHVDQYRVILEAEKVLLKTVEETIKKIRKEFGKIYPPEEKLLRSARLYHAVRKIVEEDGYDFICIKCQDEVIGNYVSYCLPVCMLNDDGIVTACESDLNAALTMQMLHLLTDQPVLFADVNDVDLKEKTLRLVNCGSIASSLATSRKDVDLGLQYEYLGKQQGCTTIFCCKPGRVTLARLSRIKGEYVMLIATGEAFQQPKERFKEVRDVWPHAFVRLDGNPKTLVQNVRSNHMHMAYGEVKEELLKICELLDIEAILV